MPTLNGCGKDAVLNHHLDVPYRLLHCEPLELVANAARTHEGRYLRPILRMPEATPFQNGELNRAYGVLATTTFHQAGLVMLPELDFSLLPPELHSRVVMDEASRTLVVEYKGAHLVANDQDKKAVGERWDSATGNVFEWVTEDQLPNLLESWFKWYPAP